MASMELSVVSEPVVTLASAYDQAQDLKLIRRCVVSGARVALSISSELPATGLPTQLQHARLAFAATVLSDPEGWGRKFAYAVMSHPDVVALPQPDLLTDDLIEAAIAAAWDLYAGPASGHS